MEAVLGILGLAAILWILVGPFLFFSHSSRIGTLSDEIRRLKRELEKKAGIQAHQLEQLTEQIRQLKEQERARQAFSSSPASSALPQTSPRPKSDVDSVTVDSPLPAAQGLPPVVHPTLTAPPATVHPEATSEAVQLEPVAREPIDAKAIDDDPWISESAIEEEAPAPSRDMGELIQRHLHRHPPRAEVNVQADVDEVTTPPVDTAQQRSKAFNEMVASQWMSWVGAVAVMIGVGFGLKYAIEEQYLGPTGRVALGILTGMATFVGAAFAMKKDYRVLAEGLAGAAMGTLYFSLFAAFQWYDLMPQMVAFAGMILVTATGLGFAGKFNSHPSAVLAMIGGFLTPFMLSRGGGNISTLFTYILILDLGVLALATFRSWGSLHLLNFFGTLLIWMGWLASNYQSDELWLTVGWITLFAVVFSLMGMWRHVIRKETSSTPDMALMLLTPLAYFAALYGLTKAEYSAYHGMMALLVAAYYLGLGVFAYLRNPRNNQVVVTLVGVGLSFVTLAVPLQLTGHWIVIAWAVESLLLIEIGLRYEKPGFRLTGFGLLVLVQIHMVLYAGGTLTEPQRFRTNFIRHSLEEPVSVEPELSALGGVINGRSLSFLANAIVLAILAWEYRRREATSRIELSEEARKRTGWKGPLPDAGQISMILIPLVPVMVLVMGLLETFVFGVRVHWSLATHLSMLPIWLSLFAVGTLLSFKRMHDVSTLGALAKCLYGITACLLLSFFLLPFPDWGVAARPLWGHALFNPRGLGFLAAIGATLVGAIQFSRSASDDSENRSIGNSLTLAVPLVLLGMCLTETFAFGQRHQWLWATQLSQGGIWLAIFSTGTLIAARWLKNVTKLEMLSRLFYVVTAGVMLLLVVTTFLDASAGGDTTKAEAWSRPLLNPRGLCLLFGTISLSLGIMGRKPDDGRASRLFATGLTLAVPITLLALCQIETYAYGQRHHWIWASFFSGIGIWLSLFAAGVLLASRQWSRSRFPLEILSQLLTVGVCIVLALLFLGTLVTWDAQIRQTLSAAWAIPFLNPRGMCFLLAVGSVVLGWKFSHSSDELHSDSRFQLRVDQTQLGLLAYAIMFLMFTIEVFALGKQREWGTATSLAITGTWSLLAVSTIGAGLMKRSAPVRILALGVFALTTAKVFLYDVWYLDKPIRIAAFVGLGVALMLTSFLYQRFRNQLKDWIKPMCLLLAALATFSGGSQLCGAEEPDLSTRLTHRFEVSPASTLPAEMNIDPDYVQIPLTPEIYAASQRELADLRVLSLDPSGVSTQIPYVLITPADETGQSDVSLPVVNRREDRGLTELVFDARQVTDPIEKLHLQVASSEQNYLRSARLYGADQQNDGDWKLLVNDAYLLDRMRDRQRLTETTLMCPTNQFRYYRVVIDNESEPPLKVTGCIAHQVRRRVAPRVSYPLQVKNEIRTERKITRAELSLAGPVPIDRLELEISGADEYHRNAQLLEIRDTSTTPLTSVALFHLAKLNQGPVTTISFTPHSSARYRLEIENGDDQPLRVVSGQAFGIQRSLVVPLKALRATGNPVAIYVGGDLGAPSYDLVRISTLPNLEQLSSLSVVAGEANPLYRETAPRKPWAEDNKTLVWVVVFAGVLILSVAATALLKAAAASDGTTTTETSAAGKSPE